MGSKLHFFVPSGSLPVNFFNTKQVSNRFPDIRVPIVLLLPINNTIFVPKTAKFGQNLAFWVILGQIFAFLVHFDAMSYQKTMGMRCLVSFLIFEYQNFCSLSKKLGSWPKNGQIWPKICIFGHNGPNIGLFDPFGAMPRDTLYI